MLLLIVLGKLSRFFSVSCSMYIIFPLVLFFKHSSLSSTSFIIDTNFNYLSSLCLPVCFVNVAASLSFLLIFFIIFPQVYSLLILTSNTCTFFYSAPLLFFLIFLLLLLFSSSTRYCAWHRGFFFFCVFLLD